MIKNALIAILVGVSMASYAQMPISKIDTVTTPYCRLRLDTESVSTMLSNKKKIFASVDFGFSTQNNDDPLLVLVDDNNKKMYFPSYVRILNLLYAKGWDVLQVRESSNYGNSEFLLRKRVSN